VSVSDVQAENAVMAERFRSLPPDRPPDDVEREILDRWREEGLFEETLRRSVGRPEYVFFEGPPTANGRPGIHHIFSRAIKDLFCRHRAMRGFRVVRKAGWDTHGLPVEIEVERQLGISGKQDIERIGVQRFNELCRESVWKYRGDWERLSERIGYWLDYDSAYITYSNEYVESVWWALKTLHERDLLYRGHKILPYCPRCGTALSSHEVAQGYRDVKDPSVYIALDLAGPLPFDGSADVRHRILVWTTTPWTLPSNVALAVHPSLEYVRLRRKAESGDAEIILVAQARVAAVFGEDYRDRWETVGEPIVGSQLVGLRYTRPLDWVEITEGEHEIIIGAEFVSADDGTGVVHMAPAFGADDYAAGQEHGLAFLQPVTGRGEFTSDIPLVGGRFVKDADAEIVEELKRRGVLWKSSLYEHPYPHCWRCDTPLLYYARSSWFVRTTDYRDAMLTRNARVDWHPVEMGEGRFGEWLKNNIDWAISRDRYWGTPLPIWECGSDTSHREVIGSYAELAKRHGTELPEAFDPHKPHVDGYEWRCAQCDGTMRRVPEVIDTWFDSGSMPFAQWHFPFENREIFERQYPADFIAEGVDQTRGWFYSLLAIAAGLGDALPRNLLRHEDPTGGGETTAPYRSVVVNDLVLDKDGAKMSKSRGNVVDPWRVLAEHGADAVRLFLVVSSQVWMPRRFDEAAIRETVGQFLLTLKNVYDGIFARYANFGWEPSTADPGPTARPIADRWILSRLASTEREADALLERYEATLAARLIMDFFVDDVSKWYVRLNRPRFYDVVSDDNRAAFATLRETLIVTCRLLAPFAPFITDWIHHELTGESVHTAPYVRPPSGDIDVTLEESMAQVRRLATLGRAAREDVGIRVRQPLSRMVCVVPRSHGPMLDQLVPLLATELNVKRVEFATSADRLVTLEAKPNFRSLGKKFGKRTPEAAQEVAKLSGDSLRGFERGEPVAVSAGGDPVILDAEDLTIVRRASGDLVVKEENGFFAALDPVITDELRAEGLARELVSRVQRMRKEAGLAVSDRIHLWVAGASPVEAAVASHREWIAQEVLARDVTIGEVMGNNNAALQADLDGHAVRVAITKVGNA
jgi:isoleucyl-tRNA synthetase